MKIFRFALLAVLMLGVSAIARATVINILDPSGDQKNAPIVKDLGTVDFSFYACPTLSSSPTVGCYVFVNGTGDVITSLTATINSKSSVPSDVSCPTGGAFNLSGAFDAATCNASGDTLTFDFSGGGVANGNTVWIVEDGIDPSKFAKDAGTFTIASTPEPNSIWLALTGMSSLGYVVRRRSRA